jgi:hypothetical protein
MRGVMAENKTSKNEIFADLRSGMDRQLLKTKYNLTDRDIQDLLDSLFNESVFSEDADDVAMVLPGMRCINAAEFVSDIRAGLSDCNLMEKYDLSRHGLASTLNVLYDNNTLVRSDFSEQKEFFHYLSDPDTARDLERLYIDFDLEIKDLNDDKLRGKVRNITEKGVGTTGIASKAGEEHLFSIHHEKFILLSPFSFKARCRWADDRSGENLAGFEIIEISTDGLAQLKKLVRMVTAFSSPVREMHFGDT